MLTTPRTLAGFVFSILAICTTLAFAQTAQERVNKLKEQAKKSSSSEQLWCEYVGTDGPGKGKHIVLIAGDDEYRSEQCLPMLGKILAMRHGFKCTVLFPIDPADGTIKPDHQTNIPGMEHLDSADLIIIGLRFRHLPDSQMKHFVDYVDSGKPIIGIRTATHSFNYAAMPESPYANYSFNAKDWKGGFGRQVLGDTWINHHGKHRVQSCRGVIADGAKDNPILNDVSDVWGPSDVYGIRNLPESATTLLNGAVLEGMNPDDKPVAGKQNDPMMPIAWTKSFKSKSGKESRIFCTTMGASTDFESEDLRRLIVNASYWGLGMESAIPESANVEYVDEYKPTEFGFGNFAKDLRPADLNLKSK
ncbi:MAG: ThuA domain-containing protein [Mariniblastus sp.]